MNIKLILSVTTFFFLTSQSLAANQICQASQGIALMNQSPINLQAIHDILAICDKQRPNDTQVLLLHGLVARKTAETSQNYTQAISWFEKAKASAPTANLSPTLELALTYEWAGQLKKAKALYQEALKQDETSRAALQGEARIAMAENDVATAKKIYQTLLDNNPLDDEARQKLQDLNMPAAQKTSGLYCQANEGLRLLNIPHPPFTAIEKIIVICDKQLPNHARVLLLHGLYERKKALQTKDYQLAIDWLKRAVLKMPKGDVSGLMELAVTYEWANKTEDAKTTYNTVLTEKPRYRPALFGLARVAMAEKHFSEAALTYQAFLDKNPNDVEALNGLARVEMAKKEYTLAGEHFKKALTIHPNDPDAQLGLEQLAAAEKPITLTAPIKKAITLPPVPVCMANKGLDLLNQTSPPYAEINRILQQCDKNAPHDVQTLLLHGILARKQGMPTHQYQTAIDWLQQAKQAAAPSNFAPALELAVTYEWNNEPKKAAVIYSEILKKDPYSRPALLGMARVYRSDYKIQEAKCIYYGLLSKNRNDTEALNGLAWSELTNKELPLAKDHFNRVLQLAPQNPDASLGLNMANNLTRYILSVNGGRYAVANEKSYMGNINFYADLNATDQFIMQLTHNSSEIQLSLVLDPTILPKNSAFFGFQHQIPNRYGWGINYEYRERTQFRVEHRLGANANLFVFNNLQWLIGARDGFPSPWNNKLFYSGLTLYTKLPINVSLTGYWGRQQFGGSTSAYAIDFSKEFLNRAYYLFGTSYSPSQLSWETHARVILPILKNQSLESGYEHLYLNGTTAVSLGWRIYW